MIDRKKAEKGFYEKFEKLVGKIFYIKTKSREYSGIKLISVDREGSPVRFLNFENKEGFTPKILAFIPNEIKQYEVKE
jgi:hypothetical protein